MISDFCWNIFAVWGIEPDYFSLTPFGIFVLVVNRFLVCYWNYFWSVFSCIGPELTPYLDTFHEMSDYPFYPRVKMTHYVRKLTCDSPLNENMFKTTRHAISLLELLQKYFCHVNLTQFEKISNANMGKQILLNIFVYDYEYWRTEQLTKNKVVLQILRLTQS